MKPGFVPALVTPLDTNGNLDEASYRKQIEDQIAAGAVGLLSMGSMGQQPYLRNRVCVDVARVAVDAAAGRVPVFVGAMDCSIARAADRLASMEHLEVTAFVFTTPYYTPCKPNNLIRFFKGVAAATKLNNAIKQNAETGEYSVTDVKQAFDDYSGEEDLYNANPSVSDIEVDFHPTAAGHRLIAECFLETMEAPRYLKITDATGEVHVIELPLDTDVTVVAVGYRDGGAMNDLAIRICSGRNHSVVFSGSKIKVFFLNTGTLIPVKPGITIK